MAKKGQGALEYLFMIAVALLVIFLAVKYLGSTGNQVSSQSELAALQSQAELVRSQLKAQDLWNDDYCIYILSPSYSQSKIGSKYGISLKKPGECKKTGDVAYYLDYSGATYREEVSQLYGNETYKLKTLSELYDMCMGGDEKACKLIITLKESKWKEPS